MAWSYTPTIWGNRIVTNPSNYTIADNSDGSIYLSPAYGPILASGTPINYANLSKLDIAIASLYRNITQLKGDISSQTNNIMDLNFELQMVKNANLSGTTDQLYLFNLSTDSDINIIQGNYDEANRRITI